MVTFCFVVKISEYFLYNGLFLFSFFSQAYYRAGHSLIMLSDSYEAISMFHKGLILLNASADRTQVADFVAGIFMSVNGKLRLRAYFF